MMTNEECLEFLVDRVIWEAAYRAERKLYNRGPEERPISAPAHAVLALEDTPKDFKDLVERETALIRKVILHSYPDAEVYVEDDGKDGLGVTIDLWGTCCEPRLIPKVLEEARDHRE